MTLLKVQMGVAGAALLMVFLRALGIVWRKGREAEKSGLVVYLLQLPKKENNHGTD